jgi:L-noviosyl transferase
MRVLFTTAPLYGHFFPLVPLAWAFRSAGHDVLVATTADFVPVVVGAGLPAVVTAEDVGTPDYARCAVVEKAGNSRADYEGSGAGWAGLAARVLAEMDRLTREYRPDLVISEPGEYAGRLSAVHNGVPWVLHSWALEVCPEFAAGAEAELAPLLASRGLSGLPRPELVIYPCAPSLLPPGIPAGLTMRYIPYNGRAVLPRWLPPERDRPRVFVSFGSLLPLYGPEKVRSLISEFVAEVSAVETSIILGIDDAIARGLGTMPGVIHAGWVPLNQVLPHCDVAVHHGGSGTSMASAAYGLPQLLLPHATDQFDTAERFVDAGTARQLLPNDLGPGSVRHAVSELLGQPRYRKNARLLAQGLAAQTPPAGIADTLARRTSGRRPRPAHAPLQRSPRR